MAVRHEKVVLSLTDEFTPQMAKAAQATELLQKRLDGLSGDAVGTLSSPVDSLATKMGLLADTVTVLDSSAGQAFRRSGTEARNAAGGIQRLGTDLAMMRGEYGTLGTVQAVFNTGLYNTTAAAQRTRATLGGLAKGAAPLAGLGLAASGVADSMGLANTATGAMTGAMLGGWGAAIGAGVGLALDFSSAMTKVSQAGADASEVINRFNAATDSTSFLDALATEPEIDQKTKDWEDKRRTADRFISGAAYGTTLGLSPDLAKKISGSVSNMIFGKQEKKNDQAAEDLEAAKKAAEELALAFGASSSYQDTPIAWLQGEGLGHIAVDAEDMTAALLRAEPAMANLGISVDDLMDMGSSERRTSFSAILDEVERLDSTPGRIESVADSMADLDAGFLSTEQSAGRFSAALDALMNPAINRERATIAWKDSLDSLKGSLAGNSRSLSMNSAAGRQNRGAILDRIEALKATLVADAEAGAGSDQLARKLRRGRNDLIRTAKAAGLNGKEVRKMAREMNLTPELVQTLVQVAGENRATRQIRRFRNMLAGIDRTLEVSVHLRPLPVVGPVLAGLQATVNMAQHATRADGGTVPKTGLPYADRHLYLLADGEEVISNRRGQADRFRPLLKAINAAADGTTVGSQASAVHAALGAMPFGSQAALRALDNAIKVITRGYDVTARGLKGLQAAVKGSTSALEAARANLSDLRSRRDEVVGAVRGNFSSQLFGNESTAWSGKPSGPLGILDSDIASLNALNDARKQLSGKGFDGGALAALFQDGSLDEIQAMAAMSEKELKTIEARYEEREKLLAQASTGAGKDAYGAEIRAANRELAGIRRDNKVLQKRLANIEKNTKDGPRDMGRQINRTAKKGARNAR